MAKVGIVWRLMISEVYKVYMKRKFQNEARI